MNTAEFGATIKQKYPQYKDMSDEDIGSKMLSKYPQYQDMVTVAPVVKPKAQYSGPLSNSINMVKDIVAAQTNKGALKSQQSALDMAERARQKAASVSDPAQKAALLKVAGEGANVVGQGSETLQGNYSPQINENYWSRGAKVGTEIATTADAVNFLTGSPAVGAFKNAKINPWVGIGPRSSPSIVTQAINLTKNVLHPLKNTGSKLEAVRSTVEIPKAESETKILENISNNRTYKINPELQKEVDTGFQKLINGTNPGAETNNLNEIYQNLNSMKGLSPDAKSILTKAVRDYANPLQTAQGVKLAKVYSFLKDYEDVPKYGIKRGLQWAIATAIAGTIGGLTWKRFSK